MIDTGRSKNLNQGSQGGPICVIDFREVSLDATIECTHDFSAIYPHCRGIGNTSASRKNDQFLGSQSRNVRSPSCMDTNIVIVIVHGSGKKPSTFNLTEFSLSKEAMACVVERRLHERDSDQPLIDPVVCLVSDP